MARPFGRPTGSPAALRRSSASFVLAEINSRSIYPKLREHRQRVALDHHEVISHHIKEGFAGRQIGPGEEKNRPPGGKLIACLNGRNHHAVSLR